MSILFRLISDLLKENTLEEEEYPVREVEVIRRCLHYQVNKLLAVRIVTLQIERAKLWNEEFEVFSDWGL